MNKPPFPVTLLLVMVLCLTAWNALWLGSALVSWQALAELVGPAGLIYIVLKATLWTIAGGLIGQRICGRRPHSRRWLAVYLFGYLAWFWLDRVWFGAIAPNWPCLSVLTSVVVVLIVYNLLHPKTAHYFHQRENHEQPQSNSRTT